MADGGNWCLIESDPGVFTELIADMGVKGTQVEEIWSLDDETLEELKHAVVRSASRLLGHRRSRIFCSAGGAVSRAVLLAFAPIHFILFFSFTDSSHANPSFLSHVDQVITNACATQAILSILLNSSSIDVGEELTKFKSFTAEFPPDVRPIIHRIRATSCIRSTNLLRLAISNSDVIRAVHNSFARSDPFVSEGRDSREDEKEDLFHFISYLPIHGALYELDGLSRGPVNLGPCTDEDWLQKVRPVIQARMAKYASSEIRFNLMALIRNRPEIYEEQLEELDGRLLSLDEGPDADALRARLASERANLDHRLANEREKFRRYKRENALRKHNFIPLIYHLLYAFAKRGELAPLVEEARKKGQRDEERRRERKREMGGKSSGMEM
ncbi:hypothetical protein BC938DRAFT_481693 [Jimgerdemannia flammicorona]|uniref:ubiquitinyl hydrolase 1 n=1 Tax=Jimgerdemannia flammicorona TaxID=994334 RepID=A0A433QFJ8_9FUNG|nr:hypothetical protein BC938DRAFT_481693 [Jimgerdemannia flammicorona]